MPTNKKTNKQASKYTDEDVDVDADADDEEVAVEEEIYMARDVMRCGAGLEQNMWSERGSDGLLRDC
jgi:hypothetical protein